MELKIDRYALVPEDKIRILNGSLLKETHVDLFHNILRSNTQYDPRSTLNV